MISLLPVEVRPDIHENDRSAPGYLPREEFEAVADTFFADLDASVRGWETARSGRAPRFSSSGTERSGRCSNAR